MTNIIDLSSETYEDFRSRVLRLSVGNPDETASVVVNRKMLYFKDDSKNSDKIYIVELLEVKGGYNVQYSYGRRGSALKRGMKNDRPLDRFWAEKLFKELVDEKTDKGYSDTPPTTVATGLVLKKKSKT